MDPLYYHIYQVGAMSYWYQIVMTLRECPNIKGKAAAAKDCTIYKSLTLDPSHTLVFDGPTPAESSVQATLIGDYSSFEKAPSFENKYLAVPAGTSELDCNGHKDPSRPSVDLKARCIKRIKEGMEKWMLIDDQLFGDRCNKIGVTYESFRYQGHFCDRPFGSCTRHQLADYYDYDQKQADEGKTGMYWLSSMSHQGLLDFTVEGGQAHDLTKSKKSNVRLMFRSNRFQNTLIQLQIKAEDITLTTNVANGKIVDWEVPAFENGSNDGQIKIKIKNTDTRNVYAQFILSVEKCDKGIKPASQAGQSIRSLTGGQQVTIPINVLADARIGSDHTNDHACTARLFNAAGEEIDRRELTFKTFETKLIVQNSCQDAGSKCGNAATGAASQGLNGVCTCKIFEFPCFVRGISIFNIGGAFSRCAGVIGATITIFLIVVVGLILLCLSFKFLGVKKTCQVLCCPLICLCKCFKCGVETCFDDTDKGSSSRERRYYSEDSPPRRKKRLKRRRKKKKKKKKKEKEPSNSRELLSSSEDTYSDSDSDSDNVVAPHERTLSEDNPPRRRREIPLAVLASNDEDEDDEHAYVSYFDNKTTTVFFNIEGDANKTFICDMEGQDFSIQGVLIGEDGTFRFTVPSKDRYVRKEMFNGEICELEEPRQLHDQISDITLAASEVYNHISKDMRAIAINV